MHKKFFQMAAILCCIFTAPLTTEATYDKVEPPTSDAWNEINFFPCKTVNPDYTASNATIPSQHDTEKTWVLTWVRKSGEKDSPALPGSAAVKECSVSFPPNGSSTGLTVYYKPKNTAVKALIAHTLVPGKWTVDPQNPTRFIRSASDEKITQKNESQKK